MNRIEHPFFNDAVVVSSDCLSQTEFNFLVIVCVYVYVNLTELTTYFNQVFSKLIPHNFFFIWHITVKTKPIYN